MRDIIDTIDNWISQGKQVAIATVVQVYGSAPRALGAKMAVNQDGLMAGSVSGGCVEGAVVSEALKILRTRQPKLLHYGVSDEQAFSVGLACGGIIEVYVEPLKESEFAQMKSDITADLLFARVSGISGNASGETVFVFPDGRQEGRFSSTELQVELDTRLPKLFRDLRNVRFSVPDTDPQQDLFFDVYPPLPRMIIVGAVHIAIPLVSYAKSLGFHTIVVDPRRAFSNPQRFPHVDELVQEWPDEYFARAGLNEGSYIVTVSHDEKLDVPALAAAAQSKARYIGALGSKKTFARNMNGLRELGVPDEAMGRIHAPIGLRIGAHGAEEIALSIMAEVIAVKNGAAEKG